MPSVSCHCSADENITENNLSSARIRHVRQQEERERVIDEKWTLCQRSSAPGLNSDRWSEQSLSLCCDRTTSPQHNVPTLCLCCSLITSLIHFILPQFACQFVYLFTLSIFCLCLILLFPLWCWVFKSGVPEVNVPPYKYIYIYI